MMLYATGSAFDAPFASTGLRLRGAFARAIWVVHFIGLEEQF